MNVFQITLERQIQAKPSVVTIGNFDGVHIGHQQLLQRSVMLARKEGLQASVMTFSPHPRQVLGHGTQYDRSLTPLSEKFAQFERMGIDQVFLVEFTRDFASVPADVFVRRFLAETEIKHVVVGYDFTFGPGGKANAHDLLQLCQSFSIPVDILPPVNLYGEKVSSSLIREKLQYGDMKLVRELLGRPYAITGNVVRGEGRGNKIGFPTANLEMSDPFVVPKIGVYAVHCVCDGQSYSGVMNIGYKPTFHDKARALSMEVHLFQFQGDLYHKEMRVSFVDFIRPEQKFASVQELVEQIQTDCETARKMLWMEPDESHTLE
jgi:riboflavin kinase / FMN adenylyltransferase